jgi:hypothetical protein
MLARRVLAFALFASPLCVLGSARPASADPADPPAINHAIDWGVKYLQNEQKPNGVWGNGTGPGPEKGWGIGHTALAALTLIECGVPTTDPGIKRAAYVVRANVADITATYELALSILLLDRMKEKSDKKAIQLLAGRLIAAQMPSGGWGYKAIKRPLQPDVQQLLDVLRKMSNPPAPPAAPLDLVKLRASLPPDMRRLPVLFDPDAQLPSDPKDKGQDVYDATTDNSNTHFAMLGLWAARGYDVPTDRTFARVSRRFRTTQGRSGTWAYPFVRGGADGGGATTCIALLGVAIGQVVAPEPGVRPETDPLVLNAFTALSRQVGEPAGTTSNRPTLKAIGGLYFLWATERVAVLYDLPKLGQKDWYLWGAEILLCHQLADGSWADDGGYYGQNPILNTCFALLFLRRANLTPDLSKQLAPDSSALAAQVDSKITKYYEQAPPPHAYQYPTTTELKGAAPATVAPKQATTQFNAPAPPAETSEPVATAAPAKKTPWVLIGLGTMLAGALGGGLAFFIASRKKDEDEEEKKKKKKKKKAQAEGGKKAKARAEVTADS